VERSRCDPSCDTLRNVAARARSILGCSIAAAMFVAPRALAGPSTDERAEQCITDAANAQRMRDAGHLTAARARFVACAADTCPSLVKRDCVQWLADVDARLPAIVVSARAKDGRDLVGTTVVLDGKPLPAGDLGRSLQLDPGPHTVRASLEGYETKAESIVVAEREKGRAIVLVLTPTSSAITGSSRTDGSSRGIPVLSWILGGVAIAGGAGFGFFWSQGMDEVGSLRRSCAPYCTDGQIDEARAPHAVARVSLGIGITAALGALAAYALSSRQATKPRGPTAFATPSAPW
jgi:hypothetical protein